MIIYYVLGADFLTDSCKISVFGGGGPMVCVRWARLLHKPVPTSKLDSEITFSAIISGGILHWGGGGSARSCQILSRPHPSTKLAATRRPAPPKLARHNDDEVTQLQLGQIFILEVTET